MEKISIRGKFINIFASDATNLNRRLILAHPVYNSKWALKLCSSSYAKRWCLTDHAEGKVELFQFHAMLLRLPARTLHQAICCFTGFMQLRRLECHLIFSPRFEDVDYNGTFYVHPSTPESGYIGLVLSYQSPGSMYLLAWRQSYKTWLHGHCTHDCESHHAQGGTTGESSSLL